MWKSEIMLCDNRYLDQNKRLLITIFNWFKYIFQPESCRPECGWNCEPLLKYSMLKFNAR